VSAWLCSIVAAAEAQTTVAGAMLFQNVRIYDGTGKSLSAPSNVPGAAEATATLMRGFTTVRDVGGPSFGLKRAIDEGVLPGPRIYPSGAMITVTSGHGDFRASWEVPRTIGAPASRAEQVGAAMIADGPDEVTVRVREQLLQGASQIKLTAGGGVSSPHSPLDVSTFTEAELRAAVEAAANWGTYVTVHAYTPAAVQRAIAAGVQCIEHAHLMDDATARMTAEKGVWLSMQPLPDELAEGFPPGSEQRAKAAEVFAGTPQTYALAKKYGIRTAWGTDVLFPVGLARQARRGRGRRAGGPAARRRQPAREHRARRGPGSQLPGDHEGERALKNAATATRKRPLLACPTPPVWVRFPSPAPLSLAVSPRQRQRARPTRHGAVGRARLASLKCPFAPADGMLKSLVGKAAFRPDGTLT
jgi:hypothetical protein